MVATVDAVNGLDNLDGQPVAARQCAVADRRIVTKSDMADPEPASTALKQRLRALNPGADILRVNHGRIDADRLFGASLYDAKAGRADIDRWLNIEAHRNTAHREHHHGGDDGHAVATWLIEESGVVDWEVLSPRLGGIIGRHGDCCFASRA